mgnify:CR=1 FL=1
MDLECFLLHLRLDLLWNMWAFVQRVSVKVNCRSLPLPKLTYITLDE